jgi:hypothetical protein
MNGFRQLFFLSKRHEAKEDAGLKVWKFPSKAICQLGDFRFELLLKGEAYFCELGNCSAVVGKEDWYAKALEDLV